MVFWCDFGLGGTVNIDSDAPGEHLLVLMSFLLKYIARASYFHALLVTGFKQL
jgi:hypothetical protein